jgi:hypothetical protein
LLQGFDSSRPTIRQLKDHSAAFAIRPKGGWATRSPLNGERAPEGLTGSEKLRIDEQAAHIPCPGKGLVNPVIAQHHRMPV